MPFAAVNGIDVYFELHDAGPASKPEEAFAMRCRLTDRRFDPDAIIEFLEFNGGAS